MENENLSILSAVDSLVNLLKEYDDPYINVNDKLLDNYRKKLTELFTARVSGNTKELYRLLDEFLETELNRNV